MQQTLRPYSSAGIVLASAGLIAITPIARPALDIQTRAVQLTSAGTGLDVDAAATLSDQQYPITTPAELVSDTTTNLEGLQNQFANDPFPILEQIAANQAQYGNDLATAFENATNDLTSAAQGFDHVMATGNLFQEIFGPYSQVVTTLLQVQEDLQNGVSEVEQGVANNIDNLVNDTGALAYQAGFDTQDNVPVWLSLLDVAPLYAPNAAVAGFAGVADDIQQALKAGDFTTALSDLANAPSTVLDASLNGYDVGLASAGAPAVANVTDVADLARRVAELPPRFALLTGAVDEQARASVMGIAVSRGGIENVLQAREDIARDLGAERAIADLAGAHSATSTDLLSGVPATDGLSSVVGDLTALFEPGAASDVGSSLSTDLSSLLLSLF